MWFSVTFGTENTLWWLCITCSSKNWCERNFLETIKRNVSANKVFLGGTFWKLSISCDFLLLLELKVLFDGHLQHWCAQWTTKTSFSAEKLYRNFCERISPTKFSCGILSKLCKLTHNFGSSALKKHFSQSVYNLVHQSYFARDPTFTIFLPSVSVGNFSSKQLMVKSLIDVFLFWKFFQISLKNSAARFFPEFIESCCLNCSEALRRFIEALFGEEKISANMVFPAETLSLYLYNMRITQLSNLHPWSQCMLMMPRSTVKAIRKKLCEWLEAVRYDSWRLCFHLAQLIMKCLKSLGQKLPEDSFCFWSR